MVLGTRNSAGSLFYARKNPLKLQKIVPLGNKIKD
jgi:hypothetical protein